MATSLVIVDRFLDTSRDSTWRSLGSAGLLIQALEPQARALKTPPPEIVKPAAESPTGTGLSDITEPQSEQEEIEFDSDIGITAALSPGFHSLVQRLHGLLPPCRSP